MGIKPTTLLLFALGTFGLSGCHNISRQSEPQSAALAVGSTAATGQTPGGLIVEEPQARRAWVVNEAKLPPGFPPPGPVKHVIIKHYPAYRAAVTTRPPEATVSDDGMFMVLFRHIKKHQIAMTAPVEMTYETGQEQTTPTAMAFMYPDQSVGVVGADEAVEVLDVPAMTVLSIGVRGGYGDRKIRRALSRLYVYLEDHPGRFKVLGPPRFLGYNSPFVPPFMRYGEAQIPVEILSE